MIQTASKTHSAVQMVRTALERAHHYQDTHHIFTFINDEAALAKAAAIDQHIQRGESVGPLAGVPYALKDNFLSPEGETTASAHILEGFTSPVTATAVQKLEDAGAIMIGRTNLDAFAHGSSTENSYFGPTKNSRDPERVAGGSSGGSAVAVALGIVPFATGTDTGGSIRQPALMRVTAGQDPYDLTTLPDYYQTAPAETAPRRIGVIKDFDNEAVDLEIRAALQHKLDLLRQQGHQIIELSMPSLKYALAAYYIIVPAEVASNLSRHDGVRYGFRSTKSQHLAELYQNTRDEGFMPENKRRIMIGNFVLSSGYYDAYYLKAAKARTLIIQEYEKAFKQCDFILTPVSPNPAFKLGEKVNDPIAMYLEDVMSVPLNLAGVPGLAIPAGETKSGLALGLQLVGPRRSDAALLQFAKTLEENL